MSDDDQVLSDEEKDALLDGVDKGEVEVQSTVGPTYAAVRPFDISPRNHIVTNSFPRLQKINRKLADAVGKAATQLLSDKLEVLPTALSTITWGEFCEQTAEPALIVEFEAAPLQGAAVIHVQKTAVGQIVERFYGGSDENPPRHETDGFTRGECNVIALFGLEILKGIEETWAPLIVLETRKTNVHQSTDVSDMIDDSELVIVSEFEIQIGEETLPFHVVWPSTMIASLLPVFEGQKRDRDAAEDARWESTIRTRVPEAIVDISSSIGNARVSLRKIATLEVGDVIDFDNPRKGTVFSNDVAIIEGNFGVHDGCYAIEATRWLCKDNAGQSG